MTQGWHAPLARGAALRLAGLLAVLVGIVDQVSKAWILGVMQPPRVIEMTPFFNLVLGWNRGVSFGLFNSDNPWGRYVFVAVAAVVVAALLYWLWREATRWSTFAVGLIVGGAVGNVVDRVQFGAVVDFLDFHVAGYHWPAFNAADSGICIGAAMLVVESLFTPAKKP